MNIAIGVISPSAAWIIPRAHVDALRRDFPQHTILEAWDREALRRVLVESDAAFAAFLDKDLVPSLTRLRGSRRRPPASPTCCRPNSPRVRSS